MRNISSKRFVCRVAVVVLAATFSLHLGRVTASAQCTTATLNSSYGLLGWGAGSPFSAGFASVGKATFDGAGNALVTFNQSPSPPFARRVTCSGTYTVNADCTASVIFDNGGCTQGVPFLMTIVGKGSRIFMLNANPANLQYPYVYMLERIN